MYKLPLSEKWKENVVTQSVSHTLLHSPTVPKYNPVILTAVLRRPAVLDGPSMYKLPLSENGKRAHTAITRPCLARLFCVYIKKGD